MVFDCAEAMDGITSATATATQSRRKRSVGFFSFMFFPFGSRDDVEDAVLARVALEDVVDLPGSVDVGDVSGRRGLPGRDRVAERPLLVLVGGIGLDGLLRLIR